MVDKTRAHIGFKMITNKINSAKIATIDSKLPRQFLRNFFLQLFFSFLGWYLNKKGLLANSFTPISPELINIYATYVPIPLSFLAIIRYIKKKKIKFKKSYDTTEDNIYY